LADCRNCGKKLPAFTFGELSHLCRSCRAERERQRRRFAATNQKDFFTETLGPHKATWGLLAANLIVFAAMVQAGVSPVNPEVHQLIAKGANFGPKTIGDGEYWRLITAGFVHIGILHLLMNMICLWGLSRQLERFFGAITTISVYLLTAVGGSLLSLSYDPYRVSAGASGAVFGITGTLVAYLYYGKHDLTAIERRAELRSTVQFALINLFLGLQANIDNMAHLGGLVTGVLIGVALSRRPREDQQRIPFGVLGSAAVILVLLFVPVVRAKKPVMDMLKAEDAYDRRDWKTAAELLRQRIAKAPNDATAHALLGYCLQSDKQVDAAIGEYQRTLQLDASIVWVRLNLVELQLNKQDYAAAKQNITPLLDREPADPAVYLYYGQALAGLKDYRAAEEALRKSLQIEDSSEAHSALAEMLRAQGRMKEADAEDRLAAAKSTAGSKEE
jgi:membrane associated rhomboid family serine protease